METPLSGNTGYRQEHQTADGGQQHLGDKRSHCDSNKRPQDFWKTWKDLRDCLLVSNHQIFWRSDQTRDWRGDSHTLTTSTGGSLKFKWLRRVCMCTVIGTAAVCVSTGTGLQSQGTLLSHMFEIVAQQQQDKSEAIYGELHNLWSQCWVKVFPQKQIKVLARPWAYREFFETYFSYTGQSRRWCVESQTLSFSWVNWSSAVAIETTVSFGLLTLASRKHLYASLQICVWRECGSEGRRMWMLKVRCRLRMLC